MSLIDVVTPLEFFEKEPEYECSKGWTARCARSKGKKCRCMCHGHNHGNPQARIGKNGKQKGNYREHLGIDASTSSLFLPYGREAMRLTPNCRDCGLPFIGPVIGYPHDGGWLVPGFPSKMANGRWWLFIVCEGCNYEMALWKMGLSRDWTPQGAAA